MARLRQAFGVVASLLIIVPVLASAQLEALPASPVQVTLPSSQEIVQDVSKPPEPFVPSSETTLPLPDLSAASAPDLTVVGLAVDAYLDGLHVAAAVVNEGGIASPPTVATLSILLAGQHTVFAADLTVPLLATQSVHRVEFVYPNPTPGLLTITLLADSTNLLPEPSESNNNARREFLVAQGVDLDLGTPTSPWVGHFAVVDYNANHKADLGEPIYYSEDEVVSPGDLRVSDPGAGTLVRADAVHGERLLKQASRTYFVDTDGNGVRNADEVVKLVLSSLPGDAVADDQAMAVSLDPASFGDVVNGSSLPAASLIEASLTEVVRASIQGVDAVGTQVYLARARGSVEGLDVRLLTTTWAAAGTFVAGPGNDPVTYRPSLAVQVAIRHQLGIELSLEQVSLAFGTPEVLETQDYIFEHAVITLAGANYSATHPFEAVDGTGGTYLYRQGEGLAVTDFAAATFGEGEGFTLGSKQNVRLTEYAMELTIQELPILTSYSSTDTDDNGIMTTDTWQEASGRLVLDFGGPRHVGQEVRYNRTWLDDLGIYDPRFTDEMNATLPARMESGDWVLSPPHFSAVYTFNSDTEGFGKEKRDGAKATFSRSNNAIKVETRSRDAKDTIFKHSFKTNDNPVDENDDWVIAHTFSVGDHGGEQKLYLLFAGANSVSNLNTAKNKVGLWYRTEENRLGYEFEDDDGDFDEDETDVSLTEDQWYHVAIGFCSDQDRFTFTVWDSAGAQVWRKRLNIGDRDFSFEKMGLAAAGWDTNDKSPMKVTVDDFRVIDDACTYLPTTATSSSETTSTPTSTGTPSTNRPNAGALTLAGTEDRSVPFKVSATDADTTRASDISFAVREIAGSPLHGKFQSSGTVRKSGTTFTQEWAYSPNKDWFGTDSFEIVASDKTDAGPAAVSTVTIAAVNDPPVVKTKLTTEGTYRVRGTVTTAGTRDPDGDALTFEIDFRHQPDSLKGGSGNQVQTESTGTVTLACLDQSQSYGVRIRVSDGTETVSQTQTLTAPYRNDRDDHDGLNRCEEEWATTKYNDSDTDDDGLNDGFEFEGGHGGWTGAPIYKSSPVKVDGDEDGFSDYVEFFEHRTNPVDPDFDDDGSLDGADADPHADLLFDLTIPEYVVHDPTDAGSEADVHVEARPFPTIPGDTWFSGPSESDSNHGYPNWRLLVPFRDGAVIWGLELRLMEENGASSSALDLGPGTSTRCLLAFAPRTGSWQSTNIFGASSTDWPGDPTGYGRCSGNEDGSHDTWGDEPAAYTDGPGPDGNDADLSFWVSQTDDDGDGLPYYWEFIKRTAPTTFDPRFVPFDSDTNDANDAPGPGNPNNDRDKDPDGDGLTNWQEFAMRRNPTVDDVRGLNLKFSLEWNDDGTFEAELMECVRLASDYLWDVTDGHMYIASAEMFNDQGHWDEIGIIRIHDVDRTVADTDVATPGDGPPVVRAARANRGWYDAADQYQGAGQIFLYRFGFGAPYLTNLTDPASHLATVVRGETVYWYHPGASVSSAHWARTLVHELGHFALDSSDQYVRIVLASDYDPATCGTHDPHAPGRNGAHPKVYRANGAGLDDDELECDIDCPASMMWNQWSASEIDAAGECPGTKHHDEHGGRSVWQQVFFRYGDQVQFDFEPSNHPTAAGKREGPHDRVGLMLV